MEQQLKKKNGKNIVKTSPSTTPNPDTIPEVRETQWISLSEIDPSPVNYRTVFPKAGMDELAASMAIHGIIENITIRRTISGRFEIVTGERRLRAAIAAGLKEAKANVRDLTDDPVREIQLIENLQRGNPHPLDEAEAIKRLMDQHQSIDNIAARLGKSKAFVFGRIKLLSLIPPFREMFAADSMTLIESLSIATLSAESQREFFDDHCQEWQEEDFDMPDIRDMVEGYSHDLTDAKFDIHDETLLPETGACTKCPFNTATLQTLFPEFAEEANCTNGVCFDRKCGANFARSIHQAVKDNAPVALLFYGKPSTRLAEFLSAFPQASALPHYDYRNVYTADAPEPPDREDYFGEGDAETEDPSDPEGERFAEVVRGYEAELEIYNDRIQKGELLPGLLITEHACRAVAFNPQPIVPHQAVASNVPARLTNVTAKVVEAALKDGTVTRQLTEAGIARIHEREERLKQLDREKVQLELHTRFAERLGWEGTMTPLTVADHSAIRLVLYQSMTYSAMREVASMIFHNRPGLDSSKAADLYKAFSSLTYKETAYLVRTALAVKSESKYPRTTAGHFLYYVADQAGLDVQAIEQAQEAKASTRLTLMEKKVVGLQKQVEKLKPTEAA